MKNEKTSFNTSLHNAESVVASSLFLCNEMVLSGGDGKQWHPQCIYYVQYASWCCFGCCPYRKSCFTRYFCFGQ